MLPLEKIKSECEILRRENLGLEKDNSLLEEESSRTIALYDITKEVCRSLDEDKVFAIFAEFIRRYIEVEKIDFIKGPAEPPEGEGLAVVPLVINNTPIGYLSAEGIPENDRDKFKILSQQFLLGAKRALLYKEIQELSISDVLTQAFTRRYFEDRFREEMARAKRLNLPCSFLMVDIDRFKDFNDRYGHLVGDVILKEVGRTIKESIRSVDLLGRYGGEEFCVLLTETDKAQAGFAAERIRRAIEEKSIRAYDEGLKVTVSIGMAAFPEHAGGAQLLVDKADRALYQAKAKGRNRIEIA